MVKFMFYSITSKKEMSFERILIVGSPLRIVLLNLFQHLIGY